jgi:nucleoside-diphosphate-sugar epimerase
MIVAVTGASGFAGGRILAHLARLGHTVLAFGRRPPAAFDGHAHAAYRAWDLTLGPVADAPAVDAVVHCAAVVDDWGAFDRLYAANVIGTRHALASFPGAPQFIYLSTSSVYERRTAGVPITEDAATGGFLNAYAQTKYLGELAVRASGRPAIVLRPHAIYGPGDTVLLPRLLAARRLGRLLAVGDGRNRVSLTSVDNLAHAVECALNRRFAFEVFNIADPLAASVDEVLRALLRALDLPERTQYIPTRLAWPLAALLERLYRLVRAPRPPLLTRYVVALMSQEHTLDISRARARLGYRPASTFRTVFPNLAAASQAPSPQPAVRMTPSRSRRAISPPSRPSSRRMAAVSSPRAFAGSAQAGVREKSAGGPGR